MPSNVLTKEDKDAVLSDINILIGRGVAFLPCPLTEMDDHTKVLAARVRVEDWTAARHASAAGYSMKRSHEYKMPYVPYDGHSLQILVKPSEVFLWHPSWEAESKRSKWEESSPFSLSEMQFLLGPDLGGKFDSWVADVKQFHREAFSAYGTCKKIVRMASTPGQLRRMMPDLLDRLGARAQKLLKDQKRASSMPFEWAEFPREPVYAAEALIAKCHLLPEAPGVHWVTRTHNRTWLT